MYNEQQLKTFAQKPSQYEEERVIKTHEYVRQAIETYLKKPNSRNKDLKMEVFLQGSYKNDTNISQSSDVDIVVRLKDITISSKTPPFKDKLSEVVTNFGKFKTLIFHALQDAFREINVNDGNKCIKVKEYKLYCNADVIPCFTYHYYKSVNDVEEGIYFITNNGKVVINYPNQHYKNLVKKSKDTNGNIKETIRVFKNIKADLIKRNYLNNGIAKSFFIENLLYNIPDKLFVGSYLQRLKNIIVHLEQEQKSGNLQKYLCANGITQLFSDENWNVDLLNQYLNALNKQL